MFKKFLFLNLFIIFVFQSYSYAVQCSDLVVNVKPKSLEVANQFLIFGGNNAGVFYGSTIKTTNFQGVLITTGAPPMYKSLKLVSKDDESEEVKPIEAEVCSLVLSKKIDSNIQKFQKTCALITKDFSVNVRKYDPGRVINLTDAKVLDDGKTLVLPVDSNDKSLRSIVCCNVNTIADLNTAFSGNIEPIECVGGSSPSNPMNPFNVPSTIETGKVEKDKNLKEINNETDDSSLAIKPKKKENVSNSKQAI
jgi:hypothetical protein